MCVSSLAVILWCGLKHSIFLTRSCAFSSITGTTSFQLLEGLALKLHRLTAARSGQSSSGPSDIEHAEPAEEPEASSAEPVAPKVAEQQQLRVLTAGAEVAGPAAEEQEVQPAEPAVAEATEPAEERAEHLDEELERQRGEVAEFTRRIDTSAATVEQVVEH